MFVGLATSAHAQAPAAPNPVAGAVAAPAAAPAPVALREMNEFTNSKGQVVDLTPYKIAPNKINQVQGTLLTALQSGRTTGEIEAANLELLAHIRIAELTWPSSDPKDSPEQRRMRIKFRSGLRQSGAQDPGQAPEVHDKLNAYAVAALPKIVTDAGYPLVSRYNAVLLLGQLDRVEQDSIKGRAAEPLPEATPPLAAVFQDVQMPEALRIGALVGLARQAELKAAAAARTTLADIALKTIAAKAPPAGFSVAGHQWARKLALQMTIGLARSGPELNRGETVQAVHKIIEDGNEPLFLRRDACLALGTLDPTALTASGVKPADLVRGVANFTYTLSKAGAPRADASLPPDLTKAEDVFLTPVEGPGFNLKPDTPALQQSTPPKKLFAEGVGYYLHCIATALGGEGGRGLRALPALDPKTNEQLAALLRDHVTPMMGAMAVSQTKLDASKLATDMAAGRSKLEQWMQSQSLIAAPTPASPTPAAAGAVGSANASGSAPGVAAGTLGSPVAPRSP